MNALGQWERVRDELGGLGAEIEALEHQLDGYEFREKFEKAKSLLRALYRDHEYSTRSNWLNELLSDPEVQAWIKELD